MENRLNDRYDVIIVGASKEGLDIADLIASKCTASVAVIDMSEKLIFAAYPVIKAKVVLMDYKNRLFGFYLHDGSRIYSTHAIIASGTSYESASFRVLHKLPSETQSSILICGDDKKYKTMAEKACKKYKQVFLATDSIEECGISADNFTHLPQCHISSVEEAGDKLLVTMSNYSMLVLDYAIMKLHGKSDFDYVRQNLFDRDESRYLVPKPDSCGESSLVPKLFAAKNCCSTKHQVANYKIADAVAADFK